MSNVVESPHVGALMDIGQERIKLEKDAHAIGLSRFGEGWHDTINGLDYLTPQDWLGMARQTMDLDPAAWASVARASLMAIQASESQEELKQRLQHHAALVVAWLEDVEGRTTVGIEP